MEEEQEEESLLSFVLSHEIKQCGHKCYPSTTSGCCFCMDIRPLLEGNCYPVYIDGRGWANEGARDEGYCPICNPKNYDDWKEKIRIERIEKRIKDKEKSQFEIDRLKLHQSDKLKTKELESEDASTLSFNYSNGDQYEGRFVNGERSGFGKMTYFDGSYYEGDWLNDSEHGFGYKNWGDGIEYRGQWENGKMNGKGRYQMADGTVIEGYFQDDEFSHF